MNNTMEHAIVDGIEALLRNPGKNRANVYRCGFVPNSYRWPAPADRIVVRRLPDGKFSYYTETYDRKRSYGRGSYITLWIQ